MRFYCDEDFTLVGSSVSVCTTEGKWSHPNPTCQGTSFFNKLKMWICCDIEYHAYERYVNLVKCLIFRESNFLVRINATFSLYAFWTTVGECTPLGHPNHGTTTALSLTHGSWVEFTCFKGYSLSGSARTQCNADGSWSDPVPTCNGTQ